MLLVTLLLSVPLSAMAFGYDCPGSAAWGPHAWAKIQVETTTTCKFVVEEMQKRVNAQPDGWHDPHNNGTYTLTSSTSELIAFSRLTGNRKYTDKMTFHFQQTTTGGCSLYGCSESQVTSVADFGTNYCSLRMLYCGTHDSCKPVLHDFTSVETDVKTSSAGAQHRMDLCMKV